VFPTATCAQRRAWCCRLMLADRLAGKPDFDTQRERRTMELLKLRFGETNLHNADIMLGVRMTCARMWILQ
jgi:hypothetical protein